MKDTLIAIKEGSWQIMLFKSFKFAAHWAAGMWGWRRAEAAVPIDLSAPWGSRGALLAEGLESWISTKHAHNTVSGTITQGPEGFSAGGLPADTKQPGSQIRHSFRFRTPQLQSSPSRCFLEKLVPSLYSYWHLLRLPSATEELRAPTSSLPLSVQEL